MNKVPVFNWGRAEVLSGDAEGVAATHTWTAGSPHSSASIESAAHLPDMLDPEGHSPAAGLVRRLIAYSSEFLAGAEIQLQKSSETDGSNKLTHSGDTVSWKTGMGHSVCEDEDDL